MLAAHEHELVCLIQAAVKPHAFCTQGHTHRNECIKSSEHLNQAASLPWSLIAGMRHSPSSAGQPKGCPFRSIACVFNQQRLYGNLQAAEGLAAASYVVEDPARWRELPVHVHDIPGAPGMRFDLHVRQSCCYCYVAADA